MTDADKELVNLAAAEDKNLLTMIVAFTPEEKRSS